MIKQKFTFHMLFEKEKIHHLFVREVRFKLSPPLHHYHPLFNKKFQDGNLFRVQLFPLKLFIKQVKL